MRWPWIRRADHEDAVRRLELRLADVDLERKKAQDELMRLLGGKPYNFPQTTEATVPAGEDVPPDPEADEADWLAYIAKNRPSQFAQELASRLSRRTSSPFSRQTSATPAPDPQARESIAQVFDQAEAEVRTNLRPNGHNTSA